MESFNVNTHLPPRKRLLAELKREGSDFDFLPPVPFLSGDLGAQLRDSINSPRSNPEEIIEVAKSVASAAAEVAAAAKRIATEKAAAAAKAKASAKSALLFLDSVSRRRKSGKGCMARTRARKKQMPVKLLYKTHHRLGSQETDEELARKLHRVINSSSRISKNKRRSIRNAVCNEKSSVLHEKRSRISKCSIDKSEEKIVGCSEDIFEREEESSYCTETQYSGSKVIKKLMVGK
ncbi:unnamed protein product [Musa acuminata var. zebrina]